MWFDYLCYENISDEITCHICYLDFRTVKNLKDHIKESHGETSRKRYDKYKLCYICKASFTSERQITDHFVSVHEGKKPFKCEVCGISVSHKNFLKRHVSRVHEEKYFRQVEYCE